MRVGLDLLSLGAEQTGMAWTAHWLARHLPALEPAFTFVFFLPPGVAPPVAGANVEIVRVSVGRHRGGRLLAEQWKLPRAALSARLDLLHTIAYGPPWLYRGTKILTIHDLAFWIMPEIAPTRWRLYWKWAWGVAGRDCKVLIAVSECTKQDAVRFLNRRPEEIRVVHSGVDPMYAPAPGSEGPSDTVRRLGLPESFVLNVGTLQPRKDLDTLLDTFARLEPGGADLHLVIVGGHGWGYGSLNELVSRRGLNGRVHLAGFVDRAAMPDLYRAARLFLFTSRYEGFGLPLLEAMASGTPVVTTVHSSIPEVVGDAALTAPPGDSIRLADAAGRLLTDRKLRDEMIRRGLERASTFSWETAAARTLDVYREVLKS
ncbi:MAG: glycosyltransferase family 1 protein [Candidatus Eisenbacteria bacterium]|nr:glycosyltransferase family 1 protein [Candidatus Eisenbacteria bacterium]